MTGRTHDLFAMTGLTIVLIYVPVPAMTLATAMAGFGANFLGGLFPDLDNASAEIWDKMRGGRIVGKIMPPLLGGHRYITHSLAGMALTGWLLQKLLVVLGQIVLVDMNLVWWGFMIGMGSHLVADSLTREGVMWFFPIPWRIGFPPFKFLRIKTGGSLEKALIFPGLLVINGYLIYQHYPRLWEMVKAWVNKPY
jgi:inner membrane protein